MFDTRHSPHVPNALRAGAGVRDRYKLTGDPSHSCVILTNHKMLLAVMQYLTTMNN